jgi:hypothetical protein
MQRLSFFFVAGIFLAGCESNGPDTQPEAYSLGAFFTPIPGSSTYDWTHQDERTGVSDSLYDVTYIGQDVVPSIDGFTPVYLLQVSTSESGNMSTFLNEYYVSDSVVISYGPNAHSRDARMVLLQDSLFVGHQWQAADAFMTSDSISVAITAEVDEYYALIHIGNKDYADVYRIVYRPSPGGVTTDAAYQAGARHVYYFARGVGKVLEIVYAPDSMLVWKNELLSER